MAQESAEDIRHITVSLEQARRTFLGGSCNPVEIPASARGASLRV